MRGVSSSLAFVVSIATRDAREKEGGDWAASVVLFFVVPKSRKVIVACATMANLCPYVLISLLPKFIPFNYVYTKTSEK